MLVFDVIHKGRACLGDSPVSIKGVEGFVNIFNHSWVLDTDKSTRGDLIEWGCS